ncbi:MAG: TolC family protein [Usitatibacter sp.]
MKRTRTNIAFLCVAAGLLARTPDVFSAESMTLAQAQRRALEIAPQVAGQGAAIRAAREMAIAAGRRPDPVLKLGVDNLPINGPDRFSIGNDFMTMRRIGVMQEATRGDKLALRSERYERQAERSEAEMNAAVATVERETAIAWIERYYAEAMAETIAQQRQESVREVEAAEAYYRAGRGSQADVFAARAAVVLLEDRLSEAQRRISVSLSALTRWIGPAAMEPLAGSPSFDRIPDELMLEHVALEHHPQVQVFAKAEQIAMAEARLAQANRQPDWNWELAYSRRGSQFSDMVSLGVSVPLPWDRANKQDREVAAKLALTEQAAAQREDVLRMHTAEVSAMVAEWKNGRERRRRYETELLPLAVQRIQAAFGGYSGGRGTLTDVLLARRGELDLRLQLLQLDLETARLWARLNFLFPVELAMKESK